MFQSSTPQDGSEKFEEQVVSKPVPDVEQDNEAVDVDSPLKWPSSLRWTIIIVLSFIEMITPLASMLYAPGLPQVEKDFGNVNGVANSLSFTVYILGFVIGPLIIAPISELYGRVKPYRIALCLYLCFTVSCALSTNIWMLISFRFLAGCAGSTPLTIGGAVVADLTAPGQRGKAMSLYVVGPLLSMTLGPAIGGFIIDWKGWRWTFWITAIMTVVAVVLAFLILRETHEQTISKKRSKIAGKDPGLGSGASSCIKISQAFSSPLRLIFLSPAVLSTTLLLAIIYGSANMIFATQSSVFQNIYHFSVDQAGLTYLSFGAGALMALSIFSLANDKIMQVLSRKLSNKQVAEHSLIPIIFCLPLVAAGLLCYGWTVQAHCYWVAPIIGLAMLGAGLMVIQISVQTYLADACPDRVASAMAASTIMRSAGGSTIPLIGPPLFKSLGLGWGISVVACLVLAFIPVSVALFIHGKALRQRFAVSNLSR